jgi:hypothetical protein
MRAFARTTGLTSLTPLVDVEEHDEEDEGHAERDLAGDAEPEPHREDRREDHARHAVERLDVRVGDAAGERRQGQPQTERESEHGADREREQRLEQRDPQVLIDVGVDEEPGSDAAEDLQRLAEEERGLTVVLEHERRNQTRLRQHVPQHEQHDEQADLPDPQVALVRLQRTSTWHRL